jgi:hypothetical protein
MESYHVDFPDGTSFEGLNPYFGKSTDEIARALGVEEAAPYRARALDAFTALHLKVEEICKEVEALIDAHNRGKLSNQHFGFLHGRTTCLRRFFRTTPS